MVQNPWLSALLEGKTVAGRIRILTPVILWLPAYANLLSSAELKYAAFRLHRHIFDHKVNTTSALCIRGQQVNISSFLSLNSQDMIWWYSFIYFFILELRCLRLKNSLLTMFPNRKQFKAFRENKGRTLYYRLHSHMRMSSDIRKIFEGQSFHFPCIDSQGLLFSNHMDYRAE